MRPPLLYFHVREFRFLSLIFIFFTSVKVDCNHGVSFSARLDADRRVGRNSRTAR